MNIVLLLYLADISNGISGFLQAVSILSLTAGAIGIAGILEGDIKSKFYTLLLMSTAILSGSLAVLLPSKEAIYLMASVKYSQELVAKPEIKQLGDKVLIILNEKLDSLIEKKTK